MLFRFAGKPILQAAFFFMLLPLIPAASPMQAQVPDVPPPQIFAAAESAPMPQAQQPTSLPKKSKRPKGTNSAFGRPGKALLVVGIILGAMLAIGVFSAKNTS